MGDEHLKRENAELKAQLKKAASRYDALADVSTATIRNHDARRVEVEGLLRNAKLRIAELEWLLESLEARENVVPPQIRSGLSSEEE